MLNLMGLNGWTNHFPTQMRKSVYSIDVKIEHRIHGERYARRNAVLSEQIRHSLMLLSERGRGIGTLD